MSGSAVNELNWQVLKVDDWLRRQEARSPDTKRATGGDSERKADDTYWVGWPDKDVRTNVDDVVGIALNIRKMSQAKRNEVGLRAKSRVLAPPREICKSDSFSDRAVHYATAVVPARPYRPKDKAKVEAGVLLVERWVLARLRHQRFFSLSELNRHIAELMQALNRRPFKKLPGSRESAFAEMDRPALRPLPESRYEFAEWKVATVGIDYHVEIAGHYYSCLLYTSRCV